MKHTTPIITPIQTKNYEVKQSKYDNVSKLPMRAMICGPSGSGKTILLQNMIFDIYKGCFEIIYIFSPSIDLDHSWNPVLKYIKDNIKSHDIEEFYLIHMIQKHSEI